MKRTPPDPPDPEVEVEVEVDAEYRWRLEQLEHAGFEHFAAFRIACSGGDYRKAIRMRESGCPERLIVNEFVD